MNVQSVEGLRVCASRVEGLSVEHRGVERRALDATEDVLTEKPASRGVEGRGLHRGLRRGYIEPGVEGVEAGAQ